MTNKAAQLLEAIVNEIERLYCSSEHRYSQKTIVNMINQKFEVSIRTIYRDIDALSGAGIPIYAEVGRNGGIHLMNDFVLDKAVLSKEEKQEILIALQSINSTKILVITKHYKSFLQFLISIRKIGSK